MELLAIKQRDDVVSLALDGQVIAREEGLFHRFHRTAREWRV